MNRSLTTTLSVSDGTGASISLSNTVNESAGAGVTGTDYLAGTQSVGTAWEALNIGDCASADVFVIKNTDADNYIQVATANDDSGVFARIAPGRSILLCAETGAVYYVKAHTAAVNISILVTEP